MNDEPSSLAPAAPSDPMHGIDSIHLTSSHAQAFVRLVEAASEVQRRYQFFVWLQSHVQVLLPHAVAVCGAYSRQRKQLTYDVFNNVVLAPGLMESLSNADSPLIARATQAWVDQHSRALVIPATGSASPWSDSGFSAELSKDGLHQLVVHGVARPERPHELETLFLLLGADAGPAPARAQIMELILPHMHATFLRTQGYERELGSVPMRVSPAPNETQSPTVTVTAREAQILHWVREGKSNQEIGHLLDISALTVKNHVQNVLRKLGATNRAHAVTLAVRLRLLPGQPTAGSGDS